jgi:bifunctional DNase/RNase
MKFALASALSAALAAAACGSAIGKGSDEPVKADSGRREGASDKVPQDPSVPGEGMVKLEVARLLAGPTGGVLVLLKEKGGAGRVAPMIVGDMEGDAMARRLSRQRYVRPLTHDLLESVLKKAGMRVVKVEIDDLKEGVFLARLFLANSNGEVAQIDSRPSDGITLALGSEAPIFMAKRVLDEIGEPASDWEGPRSGDRPAETEEEATGWPQNL